MDRKQLYDQMATRKIKPKDFEPYDGNNGRVNKAVKLFRNKSLNTGGILLDVGGGIGDLGFAVRDLFDTIYTMDISEKSLEAAKKKGTIALCSDIDKNGITLPTNSCTTITALDFIEHIIDPENFAAECARVLKKSGHVFINTPNIRFYKHIEELWKGGTFPHTSGDREVFHGGHLAFYTQKDLRAIFGSAGFDGFQMFNDEECYVQPPKKWIDELNPKNQLEYKEYCLELGCPNLLFKAVKK